MASRCVGGKCSSATSRPYKGACRCRGAFESEPGTNDADTKKRRERK